MKKVLIFASFVLFVDAARRSGVVKISPAQEEDEICLYDPDRREISLESCEFYYGCDEFNIWTLFACPDETPIFDSNLYDCG